MTRVLNLATGDWYTYTLPPEQAVVAAYAQAHGDWSTWDYPRRYGHLVRETAHTVFLEDWSALRSPRG